MLTPKGGLSDNINLHLRFHSFIFWHNIWRLTPLIFVYFFFCLEFSTFVAACGGIGVAQGGRKHHHGQGELGKRINGPVQRACSVRVNGQYVQLDAARSNKEL
jgi:hypothetical protein